jgi:hypothetical protein
LFKGLDGINPEEGVGPDTRPGRLLLLLLLLLRLVIIVGE